MPINLQQPLSTDLLTLIPLKATDFEPLYQVASDPLIWEQHPNKTRYHRQVFQIFFDGAMGSGGAYLVLDKATGDIVGCSRFYELEPADSSLSIGYTFISRNYWGKGYNAALKTLMLNHAFTAVDKVLFYIGANNIRSQKAIEKLNAIKIGEQNIAYHGERETMNFIYQITKTGWAKRINL
jgi:RimJ/RimL family protein N-acetyltransferase